MIECNLEANRIGNEPKEEFVYEVYMIDALGKKNYLGFFKDEKEADELASKISKEGFAVYVRKD